MSNEIFWGPSVDATVVSYTIQTAPDNSGPWSSLITITSTQTSTNFIAGRYYYIDSVSTDPNIWYRIIATNSNGDNSTPSVPFQANGLTAPTFFIGATPFGFFDSDPDFQVEADRIADYTRRKLGDPVMVVHLDSSQIYASFEEACLEYSAIVNSYQAKSVISLFLGSPTGSLSGSEQTYPSWNMEFQKKIGMAYNDEAHVNSDAPLYSGSVSLHTGVQKYDLQQAIASSLTGSQIGSRIQVREVYHFSPISNYRMFGTTSTINYLNSQMRFESYTPETIFYMLPIWEDILRQMQFKTSNKVRRSNYSYEIHNNELTVYPTPAGDLPLYFTYSLPREASVAGSVNTASGSVENKTFRGVSNLSNIPFGNITYSNLNSLSRTWIRRFSFELAKETEGQIRSKMNTIPIPNGDLTLNGSELIADSRTEQERLRTELKAMLDELTYDKLAARQAELAASTQLVTKEVPLAIYVG